MFMAIGGLYAKAQTDGKNNWKNDRHEVRFSIGAVSLLNVFDSKDYYWPGNYFGSYYYGNKTYLPSFNLNYMYQVKRWFAVGAILTYTGTRQSYYSIRNDRKTHNNRNHYYTFIPTVRFDWFNRPRVKLYSGLGVGIGYHSEKLSRISEGMVYKYTELYLAPEVTFFGLTVGSRLYGFGEIGLGLDGIVRGGIGYKFNGGK